MSFRKLKGKVSILIEARLIPIGFQKKSSLHWIRRTEADRLTQGITFFRHHESFSGDFYIRYESCPELRSDAMDYRQRMPAWQGFESNPSQLDRIVESLERVLLKEAIPFLEKYQTLELIFNDYLSGTISPEAFFGEDMGWRYFNLGFIANELGYTEKAKEFYKKVVDSHSSAKFDWVKDRASLASSILRKL